MILGANRTQVKLIHCSAVKSYCLHEQTHHTEVNWTACWSYMEISMNLLCPNKIPLSVAQENSSENHTNNSHNVKEFKLWKVMHNNQNLNV